MEDIISLITAYTAELEAIDQANQSNITSCVGLILVVLGAIVTMAGIAKNEKIGPSIYKSISALFMSIPVISCLFIGILTINCRKVATYRGYLIYLEQEYNKTGLIQQKMNTSALDFLSRKTANNPVGSVMNSSILFISLAVILITFISCIVLSFVFLNKSIKNTPNHGSKLTPVELIMIAVYITVALVCLIVVAISFIDLYINDVTFSNVLNYIKTN